MIFESIQSKFKDRAETSVEYSILVINTAPENLLSIVTDLKNNFDFDLFLDVTAVDYPEKTHRFEVVYHFYSTQHLCRVRIKTWPEVPTLTHLYVSAEYMEREVHDMYGIKFKGNPDLREILLYNGFVGHPLRKDYPVDREQPQALDANPVTTSIVKNAKDDTTIINFGPSHPATHGTIQIIAELDGETISRADVHCGYLHRGFEKECERHTYHTLIPYTDRLNYCSPLINNFAYAEGVEKLLAVEITPRAKYLRTLLSEYSRLSDHVTCVAAALMEVGGMTAFLYLMTIRDYIYEHLNQLTGARLTCSYVRIGGLARDADDAWFVRLEEILVIYEKYIEKVHKMVDRNRIFIDRMRKTGVISQKDAVNAGLTGPMLRSTGLKRDLRKDNPYLAYPELDFEVPVGILGDNYDRYYVRMCEMDESVSMIRQCVKLLTKGPINITNHKIVLPEKELVYSELESLIDHTKLIIEGIKVPKGEIYVAHEGANGELGFYTVSDGSGIPYKLHVRAPSFINVGALSRMLKGGQVADIIATFGSINMIGGECDR